jgi:cytochrome c
MKQVGFLLLVGFSLSLILASRGGNDDKAVAPCAVETPVFMAAAAPGGMMSPAEARRAAKAIMQRHQQTYQSVKYTRRDSLVWQRQYDKMIAQGYKWFHNSELGTNGISCDMCHPDASDTHPETYPKFQVQLKKVALLRDMINWCIENPLEGKALAEDDPVLKSIEAYILSARAGKVLTPGKR